MTGSTRLADAPAIGDAAPPVPVPVRPLPWIGVAPRGSYFIDESGAPWTPIGQNDAITWPELAGLFRRRDLPGVERHLRWLVAHDVTCLRLMLEYAQVRHRYLERPAGRFVPAMVRLWDDLFMLCERVGLRILLTPVDTFWTWLHWRHHPWNRAHGGPLDRRSRLLLCAETRTAIKARLGFAVERWGGSGALFAWDLWNEIHPAHAEDSADGFGEFIHDLSDHVRRLETRLYGRSHPQTVSLFGPELQWKPRLDLRTPIFRHPDLDFATIHIYGSRTIDDPRDTIAPAVAMGRIVRECLGEIRDGRPFLDTEHGPIHRFKDKRQTLPEEFDDEYFRHLSWAHLCSGAVGGGMRWPNRHPHVLTPGMRREQQAMARFLPLIDWATFRPRNLNEEVSAPGFHTFACADERQALIFLLRRRGLDGSGRLDRDLPPRRVEASMALPGAGAWRATAFDPAAGATAGPAVRTSDGRLRIDADAGASLAIALRREPPV